MNLTKNEISWQGSERNWFIHCMWVCKMLRDELISHKWPYKVQMANKKKKIEIFSALNAPKGKNWGRKKSCKWFIASFQTLVLQLIYLLPLLSCLLLINNPTLLLSLLFLRERTLCTLYGDNLANDVGADKKSYQTDEDKGE